MAVAYLLYRLFAMELTITPERFAFIEKVRIATLLPSLQLIYQRSIAHTGLKGDEEPDV